MKTIKQLIEEKNELFKSLSDADLLKSIKIVGGGSNFPNDERLVREYCLKEYRVRHGFDALHRLMDEIGMFA